MNFYKKFTTSYIFKFTDKYLKYLAVMMLVFFFVGSYYSLYNSPEDYQQGEYVRIMYVHVPAAWLSLGIYSFMAVTSFIYLVWKNPLYDLIAKSAAPIGTLFCFVTLITGSFWGKPTWGTWWVWDARLTSMLILFFFYIGYLVLSNMSDELNDNKSSACIAVFGFINVPIVKFSVNLWSSLHQPASVFRMSGPTIHNSMLIPLLLMFLAFCFYFLCNLLVNLKTKIIAHKMIRKEIV